MQIRLDSAIDRYKKIETEQQNKVVDFLNLLRELKKDIDDIKSSITQRKTKVVELRKSMEQDLLKSASNMKTLLHWFRNKDLTSIQTNESYINAMTATIDQLEQTSNKLSLELNNLENDFEQLEKKIDLLADKIQITVSVRIGGEWPRER